MFPNSFCVLHLYASILHLSMCSFHCRCKQGIFDVEKEITSVYEETVADILQAEIHSSVSK